jgi:hypothetical protein
MHARVQLFVGVGPACCVEPTLMHARGVPGGGRAGGVGKAGGPGLRRWCVCLHPTTRPSLAFELGFPGAISLCPARSRLCVRSETLLGDSVELIRAGCHGAGVAPERGRPRGAGLPHHEADVPRSAGTGHRSWHATPLRGRRCVGEAPEGDGRAVLLEAPEVRCLHSVLLRAWSEVTELHLRGHSFYLGILLFCPCLFVHCPVAGSVLGY